MSSEDATLAPQEGEDSSKRKRSDSAGGSATSQDSGDSSVSPVHETKKMKPEKLKGIGDGTDGCPYIIMVHPDMVGKIIGGKGAVVNDIKTRSGAKININQNFPPGVHRQVCLTGSMEQIEVALYFIEKIMTEGPASIHPNAVTPGVINCDKRIDCPRSHVGKVIGSNGETIKDMQHRTGARIQVHQEGIPEDQPRIIQVTGSEAAVAAASKLLFDILEGPATGGGGSGGGYARSSGPPPAPPMKSGAVYGASGGFNNNNWHGGGGPLPSGRVDSGNGQYNSDTPAVFFSIEKVLVGKLIGKAGATIKEVQKETGCRIQVKQDVEPCLVEIFGPPDKVRYAEQRVLDITGGGLGSGGNRGNGGYPSMHANMGMGGGYHQNYPPVAGIPGMHPSHYGGYGGAVPAMANPYGNPYGAHGHQQVGGYSNRAPHISAPMAHGGGGGSHNIGAAPRANSYDSSIYVEYRDSATGKPYWLNKTTNKTQWEPPK